MHSEYHDCWCPGNAKKKDITNHGIDLVPDTWYIEGILPKGPYLPCVSMAGRVILAGYHRHVYWIKNISLPSYVFSSIVIYVICQLLARKMGHVSFHKNIFHYHFLVRHENMMKTTNKKYFDKLIWYGLALNFGVIQLLFWYHQAGLVTFLWHGDGVTQVSVVHIDVVVYVVGDSGANGAVCVYGGIGIVNRKKKKKNH